MQAAVSAPGGQLQIEESHDGLTWQLAGTFPLPRGETLGVRFTAGDGCSYWRAVVTVDHAATRVAVHSQSCN